MGMGFLLFLLGLVVLISGLAWVATLLGIAQVYVTGGALFMLAAAVALSFASSRERTQEPAGP